MLKLLSQSPFWRTLFSAAAGFLGYGAWAYVANMNHGSDTAWRAVLAQGSYSFVITIILTSLMERLFHRMQSHSAKQRYWLSTLPVCLLLYATSWSVNYVAGTPNILLTILPGAVISSIYIFGYINTLRLIETRQKEST